MSFSLIVQSDPCLDNIITTTALTTPITYSIRTGAQTQIGRYSWTQSVTGCGTIVYSLTNQADGSADTSGIFSFGTSTRLLV
jgi:hypothetical protein